jgi:hypothetical protein
MLRDPKDIYGSRVLAETIADIINGLVEPIAIKSLIFIAISLFGCVFLSNYAFALARAKFNAGSTTPPTVHITTGPPYDNSPPRMITYPNPEHE